MARANKTENTNVKPPSAAPTAATTATDPAVDPAQTEDADPSLSQLGDDSTQPPAATATADAPSNAPTTTPAANPAATPAKPVDPEEADKFLPKPPAELPGLNDGLKGASALNDPPPAAPPADSPANLAATETTNQDLWTLHPAALDQAELHLQLAECQKAEAHFAATKEEREELIAAQEETRKKLANDMMEMNRRYSDAEKLMNIRIGRRAELSRDLERRAREHEKAELEKASQTTRNTVKEPQSTL